MDLSHKISPQFFTFITRNWMRKVMCITSWPWNDEKTNMDEEIKTIFQPHTVDMRLKQTMAAVCLSCERSDGDVRKVTPASAWALPVVQYSTVGCNERGHVNTSKGFGWTSHFVLCWSSLTGCLLCWSEALYERSCVRAGCPHSSSAVW